MAGKPAGARSCRGGARRRSSGEVPARQKGDAKEGSLSGPSFASCSDTLGKEAEPREDLPKPARRQVVASENAVDLGGAARALLRVRRGEPTARGQPGRSRRRYRRAVGARPPPPPRPPPPRPAPRPPLSLPPRPPMHALGA